jgi:hypothetical protein
LNQVINCSIQPDIDGYYDDVLIVQDSIRWLTLPGLFIGILVQGNAGRVTKSCPNGDS